MQVRVDVPSTGIKHPWALKDLRGSSNQHDLVVTCFENCVHSEPVSP